MHGINHALSPYDMTVEENKAIVDAQIKAHFWPKMPQPKQVYDEKAKKWAKEFLEQPAQYKMNLRSDYDRELIKQMRLKSEKKKNKCKKRETNSPARRTETSIGPPRS